MTGHNADGERHLDVHGPNVRELQQEDARVRDGASGIQGRRGAAREGQGTTASVDPSGASWRGDWFS